MQPFLFTMGAAAVGCWLIGYWVVFPGWDSYGEEACIRSAAGRWIASWIASPYAWSFELFRCGDAYNVLLSWYYTHLGAFTLVGVAIFWRAYRKDVAFSDEEALILTAHPNASWLSVGLWLAFYLALSGGPLSLGYTRGGSFGHLLFLPLGFGTLPALALFIGFDALLRRAKRRGKIVATEYLP